MTGWRLVGRVIAALIILVFVCAVPGLLLTFDAAQAAVNTDFLDELFEDPAFFEALIPEMAQDLARDVRRDSEIRETPLAQLNTADWEQILRVALPPEEMQQWAQDANDAFRRGLRGRGRLFEDVIIPFGAVRSNIIEDPANTVLRTLLQAQPVCEAGEEPRGGEFDLLPQCRPAEGDEAFVGRLAARWREEPRQVWRQMMPEEIEPYTADIALDEFIEAQSDEDWNVRIGWRGGRRGLDAVWLFLAVCFAAQCLVGLALVGLLAARNLRELLRWVGTPLAVAGALTLLLVLLLFTTGELGLAFGWWETGTAALERALLDAGAAFVAELWQPMLWQGGMLLLVGLGLWALSFAAPARPRAVRGTPPPAPAAGAGPADDVPATGAEQMTAGDVDALDAVAAAQETDGVEASEAEQVTTDDVPASEAEQLTAGDMDAPGAAEETAGVEASEASGEHGEEDEEDSSLHLPQ